MSKRKRLSAGSLAQSISQFLAENTQRVDHRTHRMFVEAGPASGIDLVHHYTTFDNLMRIIASGSIMPSTAFVPASERPLVWFSSSPSYELSAVKDPVSSDWRNAARALKKQIRDRGAARLGIDVRKTLAWDQLCREANIAPEMQAALSRGFNPKTWYGVIGVVPVKDLEVIEVLNAGTWQRVTGWRG